jgi:hypothetical protein
LILDGVSGARALLKGDFKELKAIVRAHWSFFMSFSSWWKKRAISKSLITQPTMHGIYPKSIIWEYFAKNKKLYTDLDTRMIEREID